MNTDRLPKTLASALHMLIAKEAIAVQIYLSYATWADSLGYSDKANFLLRHAQYKRKQILNILSYIKERGEQEKATAFADPPVNPGTMINCFEKVSEHEAGHTKAIYKLIKLSFDKDDLATWTFMQRFVEEQTAAEMQVTNVLVKLKIASGEKISSNTSYLFGSYVQRTRKAVRSM